MSEKFDVFGCGGGNLVSTKPVFGWDSKCLICASGHVIKVLSVNTGECIHELRGHSRPVTSIILSPLNRYQILSVSDDCTLIKWNYQDGVTIKKCNTSKPIVALYAKPDDHQKLLCLLQTLGKSKKTKYDVGFLDLNLKEVKKTKSDKRAVKVERYKIDPSYVSDKEKCLSLASNGLYFASVKNTYLNIYKFEDKTTKLHTHKESASRNQQKLELAFTCVSGHPTMDCVATGMSQGAIILWYNLFSDAPAKTKIHWHSNAVMDLAFTAEGSYLLSGGSECVFVKWQTTTLAKEFIPRLGASIVNVTTSEDGTVYATAHNDNSIKVHGSNMNILQHIQGLTMAFLDQQLQSMMSVGLKLDPRTKALVTNGRPGHLQFYSLYMDKQLYNLDMVGQNYVSPVDIPLIVTEVENLAFDTRGKWMATIDRRDDGETAMEMTLKFWQYDEKTDEFKLNTLVDLPHFQKVHTLRFRPEQNEKDMSMAVTTSADGKFKLWSLMDDTDIYRSNVCWNCESVGFYRNVAAGAADFSADGSLLAVAFGTTLTIWDPNTNTLMHNFAFDDQIRHLEFGVGSAMGYMVVTTETSMICWNLLTCSVSWTQLCQVTALVKSPVTEHMAAFIRTEGDQHAQLSVFTPGQSKRYTYQKELSMSSPKIIGAMFVPHEKDPDYQDYEITKLLPWQRKCQLYFMDSSQELLTLGLKQEYEDTSSVPKTLTENLPATPFSILMSKKREQRIDIGARRDEIGQSSSLFLKEILSTPAHVQPPMTSLCKGFVESLIISRKKSSLNTDSDDEDEHDRDKKSDSYDSSSDSEMDTNEHSSQELSAKENVTHKLSESDDVKNTSEVMDLKHLNLNHEHLEKEYTKLKRENFSWMNDL